MKNYDRIIMNRLLDSYENSSLYTGKNKVNVSIALHVTKREFPEYFNENSGAYGEIHIAAEMLENAGLAEAVWKGGHRGHILDKIILNTGRLAEAYDYAGRKGKRELSRKAIELIEGMLASWDIPADAGPVADAASVADVAPVMDVIPVADVAPVMDVIPVEDVAPVGDVIPAADVAPVGDVASGAAAAPVADVASGAGVKDAAPVMVVKDAAPVTAAFARYLLERLEEGLSIKEYADIVAPGKLQNLLEAVRAIETAPGEIYLREFSVSVLGDSKAIEGIKGTIARIFRRFSAGRFGEETFEEIMAEYGIYSTPNYVYFKGCGVFRIGGKGCGGQGGQRSNGCSVSDGYAGGGKLPSEVSASRHEYADSAGYAGGGSCPGGDGCPGGDVNDDDIGCHGGIDCIAGVVNDDDIGCHGGIECIAGDVNDDIGCHGGIDCIAGVECADDTRHPGGGDRIGVNIIDLSELSQGMGLSGEDVENLAAADLNMVKKVVTVENLTSFFSFSEPDSLVIYLGGYHNRVRRRMLAIIRESLPSVPYLHFGDIDAGGFEILFDLRRKTGIDFRPYRMNAGTLTAHAQYGRPLTAGDMKRLEALRNKVARSEIGYEADKETKAEITECIDLMLKRNLKLEQECVGMMSK